MLYRPRAVAFLVPNGVDGFADDVKALLFSLNYSRADYCPDYRDDPNYNDEPVLWIDTKDLDAVLQNPTFWGYLIEGRVKSYKNFIIMVECAEDFMGIDGFKNITNDRFGTYCNNSSDLNAYGGYISINEYKRDFYIEPEIEEI